MKNLPKEAELIHVGSELLSHKINSHTILLAQALAGQGLAVRRAALVADRIEDVRFAIEQAVSRSSLVVVTGGLGPTFDDLTREAAAKALGRRLIIDRVVEAGIRERYLRYHPVMPANNRKQAFVIEGAEVIHNDAGTAPGQMLIHKGSMLLLLPGPPRELEATLRKALSGIQRFSGPEPLTTKVFHIAGNTESEAEEKARALVAQCQKAGVQTTILAAPYVIDLVFQMPQSRAQKLLVNLEKRIAEIFQDDLVGCDGENLPAALGALLLARGQGLSLAESCTGGLCASKVTDVVGSSGYFDRGFVAYSNAAKSDELGVPKSL
ncbi:MAG: molybdopterin-binding protein, partial [Elusimicrobiota bacterium]